MTHGRLERIKEELAYLRLKLSILAASAIGLIGWGITHAKTESPLMILGALVLGCALAAVSFEIDQQINRKLFELSGD